MLDGLRGFSIHRKILGKLPAYAEETRSVQMPREHSILRACCMACAQAPTRSSAIAGGLRNALC